MLVGLGAGTLSMSASALTDVRASLARYTLADAQAIAGAAMDTDSAVAAREAAWAAAAVVR